MKLETIKSIVGIHAQVPATARLTEVLGAERKGSGIVIDQTGLVLTIGYLIVEADIIEVVDSLNQVHKANFVAYDNATGFGLVRANKSLKARGINFGNSSAVSNGDETLIISHFGPPYLQPVKIASVREFAGFWEYLLEDAIFTSPISSSFAGSALVNKKGELIGIGSLALRDIGDVADSNDATSGNMFVPIDALKPILTNLVEDGRSKDTAKPWLGIYTDTHRGHIFILNVAKDSPASRANLRQNDIVVAVDDSEVSDLSDFYRKVWASGPPGSIINLSILRGGQTIKVQVKSEDRQDWLKLRPLSRNTAML